MDWPSVNDLLVRRIGGLGGLPTGTVADAPAECQHYGQDGEGSAIGLARNAKTIFSRKRDLGHGYRGIVIIR